MAEIAGVVLIWRTLREDAPVWQAVPGGLLLAGYGLLGPLGHIEVRIDGSGDCSTQICCPPPHDRRELDAVRRRPAKQVDREEAGVIPGIEAREIQ